MAKVGAFVCGAIMLLTGCAGGSLRFAGAGKPASEEGYREAAEVRFTCDDGSETVAPLLAPLAAMAVDSAVGAVSALLADAQKARSGSWTANQAIQLACATGKLTVTRGIHHAGRLLDGDAGPEGKPVYPAFKLVADVTIREGGSGPAPTRIVTIIPTRLDYAQTSARSRGTGRKSVMLNIGLAAAGAASDAGGSANGGTAGAMLLDLGRVEIGKFYTSFGQGATTAVPVSGAYSLHLIVTESEDPSTLLKAFSAAFDANRDDLSAALKAAIIGK